jgi:tetratricopeptide (TPR) repeat protein
MGSHEKQSHRDRHTRHRQPPEPQPSAAPAPLFAFDDATADRWWTFIVRLVLIVVTTLWIYAPSYHGDWLWDDDQAITANPTLRREYSFHRTWVMPVTHAATEAGRALAQKLGGPLVERTVNPEIHGADYFPLTATATWLQWQWFGMNSTGYHAVTIVLHIIGALLLWWLLYEMDVPGAWLGGFLFAIHPLCVESVAWVSELKNTLSMPLFLLAAIGYVRSEKEPAGSRESLIAYGLSVVCFLLSMLAKTSVVMFPVTILLHAWWRRGAVTSRDIGRSAPFFAISLLLGLVTVFFQHDRAIGQEKILVPPYFTADGWLSIPGLFSRIAVAGMAILFYLWKTCWPFDLLTIYPRWDIDPPKVWQLLPWPLMAAAVWWLWKHAAPAARPNWQRHALFAFGFFVAMLFPILGFITISYMRITWVADHFAYLPMISLVGLAAAGIATAYGRLSAAEKPLAVAGGSMALACLAYASFSYAFAWAGEESLWPHTLRGHANPCTLRDCGCWQAHNRLGAKKFARGDLEAAHVHFQNSTRLRPDLGETHNNLGTTHSARAQMAAQQGNQEAAKQEMGLAIEKFRDAYRATPHVPAIQVNYANSLAAAGRFGEAAEQYEALVAKLPKDAALWNNYGVALFKAGETEPAIDAFRRALAINPGLKDAQESLAVATGEKPAPAAVPPAGGQLQLQMPSSPTLGPAPLGPR